MNASKIVVIIAVIITSAAAFVPWTVRSVNPSQGVTTTSGTGMYVCFASVSGTETFWSCQTYVSVSVSTGEEQTGPSTLPPTTTLQSSQTDYSFIVIIVVVILALLIGAGLLLSAKPEKKRRK